MPALSGVITDDPILAPPLSLAPLPKWRFKLNGTELQGAVLEGQEPERLSDVGTLSFGCPDTAPGLELVFTDELPPKRGPKSPVVTAIMDDQVQRKCSIMEIKGKPGWVSFSCEDFTTHPLRQVMGFYAPEDPDDEEAENKPPNLIRAPGSWAGRNVHVSGGGATVTLTVDDSPGHWVPGGRTYIRDSFAVRATYDTTYTIKATGVLADPLNRPLPETAIMVAFYDVDSAEIIQKSAQRTGFGADSQIGPEKLEMTVDAPAGTDTQCEVYLWASPDGAITWSDVSVTAEVHAPAAEDVAPPEAASVASTVEAALLLGCEKSLAFMQVVTVTPTDLIDYGTVGQDSNMPIGSFVGQHCGRATGATVDYRFLPDLNTIEVGKRGTLGRDRYDITLAIEGAAGIITEWRAGSTGAATESVVKSGADFVRQRDPDTVYLWADVTNVPAVITDAGIVTWLQAKAVDILSTTADDSPIEATVKLQTPPGGRFASDWLLNVGVPGDPDYRPRLRVGDRIFGSIRHGSVVMSRWFTVTELAPNAQGDLTMAVI